MLWPNTALHTSATCPQSMRSMLSAESLIAIEHCSSKALLHSPRNGTSTGLFYRDPAASSHLAQAAPCRDCCALSSPLRPADML